MQQEKNNLLSFATQAGLGLGGFWIFKYLFVIGATQYPALEYVNLLLIFFTPLLLLFYMIRYKNLSSDNKLKYWTGIKLGILLFFFAAIIESSIVIVHIVWLDPSYISMINSQMIELLQSFDFSESIMDEFKRQISFSPITHVVRQIMNNVTSGLILSLMLTPIASRINIDVKNLDK